MKIEKLKNAFGGTGEIIMKHILGDAEMSGRCGLYADITLPSGSSIGYHDHHGESETYYVLKGAGEYDDNGTKRQVKAGDITFTPDGHGHGLVNTGSEDLQIIALIIFDNK